MDLQPTMIRGAWRALLLCRRYRLVSFHTVPLRSIDGRTAVAARGGVRWAIAESQDGQLELLGPWVASPEVGWDELFSDLAGRGVVSLGRVIGAEGAAALKALSLHFPTAKVQETSSDVSRQSSSFGPFKVPRQLKGKGTFASGTQVALTKVETVLRRADRRLAGGGVGSCVPGLRSSHG